MNRENHQLSLEPIDDGAWRLCDRNVDSADADSLVAYIERRGGRYEITWIHDDLSNATYDSLGELLAEAATALAARVTAGIEGVDA
ncbi:hypothetical protein [Microbacterium sp. B24]|uniref:hypothetical protein n=1 Tax=Microbacterium sp. B24 TaxID=95616 RepID=UPI000411D702|nr:hypothetical protein [Microbacterium sp. B24]